MKHRRIIGMSVATLLLCAWSMAAEPTTRPTGDYAAFQGGGALLGIAPPIAPPPMKVRWTYKTNEAERAGLEGAPVILGGSVFLGDSKGTLHAVDLKSGQRRWKYDTDNGFATTPLVAGGRVCIGDLAGTFHAVSAEDGRKLWTVETESGIHSSANLAGSRVLFGTDGADLFCLNAADGKVAWKGKAGDRVNSAPSIGEGLAFFSGCDSHLRAVDLAGGQEKSDTDLWAVAPGSAVMAGDRIVVGTDQGRVVCLSLKDRKPIWTYEKVKQEAMVYATPAVSDGVVVVGARDRQVHAIDLATGKARWTFATRGDVDGSAIISGGRVYVGSKDRKLYVLDLKTGRSLWEFTAAGRIEAGVAIGEGVVVFGDSSGNVYCLE